MKKYFVQVTRTMPIVTSLEIEADSIEAAEALALSIVEADHAQRDWEELEPELDFEIGHIEEM